MSRKPQKFGEFLTVGKAAQFLGVSAWTLRNWDKAGKLTPLRHPQNGYRIYRHEELQSLRELSSDGPGAAPAVDWKMIRSAEHCVQLYESDAYLAEAVANYLMPAMMGDSSAVVVVTPEHREAIQARLRTMGVDENLIGSPVRCVWLDAAETLGRFMVEGLPDPQRFKAVIGPLICQSGAAPLRAFGEMVAMLWLEGKREAAVRLEGLWNALAKQHPFALMCAYPIRGFGEQGDASWLGEICKCHTRVIPAESYSGPMGRNERFAAVAELQRQAHYLGNEISHRVEVEKAQSRREGELLERERAARDQVERVSRLKNEFLTSLSQELRTPLDAILSGCQNLKERPGEIATVMEAIEAIERNARIQTTLLEKIAMDCQRPESSSTDLRGVRVLAVDDEPDARRLVARLLSKYGAEVATAGSADEAIEILQRDGADVLISDIGMPQTDGYELISAIRGMSGSALSRIPAIALTAFARSEDQRRALLAGFQVHLAKPVEPSVLVITIANLAGRLAATHCNG